MSTLVIWNFLGNLAMLIAAGGIAYLLLAIWRVHEFRERRAAPTSFPPKVTVMVPVHGAPARLYDCLRSICDQDYPDFQVVFGLHHPDDPGRAVIERVRAEFPHRDHALVIDERRIGANPKICNLANMYRAARHDVIVTVDSDVLVDPRFLRTITAPLADPAVGGVTCLYKGVPAIANFPSVLGALYINDWFIPSALVDLGMREMDLCYGAACAMTRRSLEATGGFAARASAVAEDDVLGELLCRAGFKIRLASCVVATVVSEPGFRSLFSHELRWMNSVRACRPWDHLMSVVMHATLPAAVLAAARPTALTSGLLAAIIALRIILHFLVRARFLPGSRPSPWLVPLRDCLNFCVWGTSFMTRSMRWGDLHLRPAGARRMVMECDATGGREA